MYKGLHSILSTGLPLSSRAKHPEQIGDFFPQPRLASSAKTDHDSDAVSDRTRVDPERGKRMVRKTCFPAGPGPEIF